MASGNAGIDRVNLASCHQLGLFDGSLNRLNSRLNIDDDTLLQPPGRMAADANDLWSAKVPERLAIMLGAEGPGLTDLALSVATRRIRIPISRDVDSLNVGHAAAITFAAIARP